MSSFFRELRRRNVYRAGAAYAVGGWLLVQIATQVLPIFDVSPIALRVIVLAIVAGFPVALILAWVYEVTPQGIVRTDDVPASESITRQTGRKLNAVIIGVLIAAVLFLIAQRYLIPQHQAPATAAITDKSIAVLPFANLSEDKSNAYFAEGIQDEILTRLAKIGALKVISRTSTQRYASSPDDLPDIARQLGVANILEGSVQKIGDAVHINVQLIRAATDDHLWAEIYDRKLDDIFSVESAVAGEIATKLNATLTGAEKAAVDDKPTQNVAAYDAYLRGRALDNAGYGFDVARAQVDAYSEAVRLDPQFAQAWAYLAMSEGYLYFNGVDPARFTAESVKRATDMAMRLQPKLLEAQLAQGHYYYRVLHDFDRAADSFRIALTTAPGSALAAQSLGLVERRQGHWDDALTHLEYAATLDPKNVGLMVALGGETYANLDRYDDARRWLDRAHVLEPHYGGAIGYKGFSYMLEGRLDEAAQVLDPVPFDNIDPFVGTMRVYLRLLQNRNDDAISEANALLTRSEDSLEGSRTRISLYLGLAQLRAGQRDAARATFATLATHVEPLMDHVDDSLVPIDLAVAYAHADRRDDALRQAQHAVDLYANDAIWHPTALSWQAHVQAVIGDRDGAIAAIEPLLHTPSGLTPALLRLDPMFDPLRGDPRFEKLASGTVASATRRAPSP